MKIISIELNDIGAYPPIQSGRFSASPAGMALWPEELSTDPFYAHNGFVTLTIENIDGVPTVTGCEPNTEAWEAWKATLPDEPVAESYMPTDTQKLRADVDYLSMMTGVDLPT